MILQFIKFWICNSTHVCILLGVKLMIHFSHTWWFTNDMSTTHCGTNIVRIRVGLFNDILRFDYALHLILLLNLILCLTAQFECSPVYILPFFRILILKGISHRTKWKSFKTPTQRAKILISISHSLYLEIMFRNCIAYFVN